MKTEEINREKSKINKQISDIEDENEKYLKYKELYKKINTIELFVMLIILGVSIVVTGSIMAINGFGNIMRDIFAAFVIPNIINVVGSTLVADEVSKSKTGMTLNELEEYIKIGSASYNVNQALLKRLSIDISKLEVSESALRHKEKNNDNLISNEIDNREYKWNKYVVGKDENNDYYCKPVTRKRVPNGDLDNKNN